MGVSWRVLVPVGLLVLGHFPLLLLHARALWCNPHYQFFPVVLIGAAALGVPACRRLGRLEPGGRLGSWVLVGLAVTLLVCACFLFSPWLGAVAALVTLLAVGHGLGGRRLVGVLLPAWLFLWIAIPLPFELDVNLVSLLQEVMARWGSRVLDVLRVDHVMEGNIVDVAGRQLMVGQACSGIHSLFAVLTCTLFFVIRARRPPVRALLLVLAAVGWVLVGNALRIVTVAVLFARWRIDVIAGWRHEALGLLIFAGALGLTLSTDQALLVLARWFRLCRLRWSHRARGGAHRVVVEWAPPRPAREGFPFEPRLATRWAVWCGARRRGLAQGIKKVGARLASFPRWRGSRVAETAAPVDSGPTRPPGLRQTWLVSRPIAAVFGLLGLAQLGLMGHALADVMNQTFRSGGVLERRFAALGADTLPARLGPFQRREFATEQRGLASSEGADSRFWRYEFNGHDAVVSVDYPLRGWHELSKCYEKKGWVLSERVVRRSRPVTGDAGGAVVEAAFAHPPGRNGYLVFCLFDRDGHPLETGQVLGYLRRCLAFWSWPWRSGGAGVASWRKALLESYQYQVFVESEYPLTSAEREQARAFFDRLRSLYFTSSAVDRRVLP